MTTRATITINVPNPVTFSRDEKGHWTCAGAGEIYDGSVYEADVIDWCRQDANWPAIKAQFFPMADYYRPNSY